MMHIKHWLRDLGVMNWRSLHYQEPDVVLVEEALKQGYGRAKLAANGALRIREVPSHPDRPMRTGRSPGEKFIVKDSVSTKEGQEVFFGRINHQIKEDDFQHLFRKITTYLQQRDIWVQDSYAGALDKYRVPVRFITDAAWMSLFSKTLFINPPAEDLEEFDPEWTVINAHDMEVKGHEDGVNSDAFAAISFKEKLCIIGGLHYGGEIKKSIFTILNYVMPVEKNVLSMHCSANTDMNGENTCLFFGLSGTGKTTLSADPKRRLIGDDQHGWSPEGVFNFEGGCYAKCINLSKENEPQIFNAIRFGSIVENVPLPPDRTVDYADGTVTLNTRATYPVEHIPNAVLSGCGPEPTNMIMLTCDAFGVLPPIAKLEPAQAKYHFLSGFTSKVAGTETGVTEPQPTFSACFGEPFMPLHPTAYGKMLKEALERGKTQAWLVNTGWTGGSANMGAKRISIPYTRAMITAIQEGKLNDVEFELDPIWNVLVPKEVPGCPTEILNPRALWKDKRVYDVTAKKLVKMFQDNFKQYHDFVMEDVKQAGPRTPE